MVNFSIAIYQILPKKFKKRYLAHLQLLTFTRLLASLTGIFTIHIFIILFIIHFLTVLLELQALCPKPMLTLLFRTPVRQILKNSNIM